MASIVLTGSKNPEKSVDFSGFLQLYRTVFLCAFLLTHILTHILTHTGKLLDSTGEEAADRIGCFGLHGGGHMGVGIQSEPCGVMAQHGGERFHVYAILERHHRKCVTQAVEGDFLQSRPLQHPLEFMQDAVRRDWASGG